MLGQEAGPDQEADARRRLWRAGMGAVFAVPAVLAVVTLFVGGWELNGAAVLLPALLIAVVGAVAAAYAGTAPLALGAMAGLVVAIGSLFRPGGVFGALMAIGAGMIGGAVGGASNEDRAPKPWASGVLGPIAVIGGLTAFILLAALTGVAADPEPASRPELVLQPWVQIDECVASDVMPGPVGAMSVGIEQGDGLDFRISYDTKGSYFREPQRSDLGYMGYVAVRPLPTGPTYAMTIGAGRPISGSGSVGRDWNGRACSSPAGEGAVSFKTVAAPGRYEAVAIVVVGQESWRSKPVQFDYAP